MSLLKKNIDNEKDYLSILSHEMKSPLSLILAAAETLHDHDLPKVKSQEFLKKIIKSCLRLDEFSKTLLLILELEDEKKIHVKKCFLSKIIQECINDLLIIYKASKVEFLIEDEVSLNTNEDLIYIVIKNLIENGIKHSNGMVKVILKKENDFCKILIQDQGKGILPQHLDLIFEKFFMDSESRKKQGNGLGLFIVKKIMDKLAGSVQVDSSSKGSCFTLKLPL
ncbi:MAG: HAMP domain-containing histidine kinase [Chlamydiae bacterium]|nr:HAMP domain-containing histidine kinase [Chlamydiota bacterium]